ncbi:MAG: DEAD/DEAH box helicase [Prolixibacteraceae bacterium]|jgi:ATP-dependent RNA helicase RhlE|nr:DEAD/DEAH box helicase [Prolixibacteraceae bacterium]NLX29396.1 DEAD/DEAH box helicase [Bacteroidales bacterium]HNQ38485.1 DEAD/DEAH box helicase [Prolixibacteraceae bacterium]
MGKRFEELKVSRSLLKALEEIGFREPTPVQELVIPVIQSGMNVVGIAQTGTGKTAAYLLPVLTRLVKAEGTEPRCLVLVPTRELSVQVGEDIAELTAFSDLRHASVFGGVGWTRHAALLEPGVDVLAATPGRLWDLYQAHALSLKKVKYLVIDEADRMLDMGFMPQLRQLFEILPARRQNLLFSATFSEKVEKMAEEFLDHYEKVEVAPSATPVEEVKQIVYRVPNFQTKLNLIGHLLQDELQFRRVILFVKTKASAEAVYRVIRRKSEGEKRIMHSDKGQSTRLNAIRAFKEGEVRILITTDLSARGLDASEVTHVINFDIPPHYEDYIHRIGRTARAGHHGTAITLVTPDEVWHLRHIEKMIRMTIAEAPVPEEVVVTETQFEERQKQKREVDRQRKVDDPSFKGAFHEKKRLPTSSGKKTSTGRSSRRPSAGKRGKR